MHRAFVCLIFAFPFTVVLDDKKTDVELTEAPYVQGDAAKLLELLYTSSAAYQIDVKDGVEAYHHVAVWVKGQKKKLLTPLEGAPITPCTSVRRTTGRVTGDMFIGLQRDPFRAGCMTVTACVQGTFKSVWPIDFAEFRGIREEDIFGGPAVAEKRITIKEGERKYAAAFVFTKRFDSGQSPEEAAKASDVAITVEISCKKKAD